MGRGKDFRPKGGGRRGFDDDFPPADSYQPPRSPYGGGPSGGGFSRPVQVVGPTGGPVDATVKWFKGAKD